MTIALKFIALFISYQVIKLATYSLYSVIDVKKETKSGGLQPTTMKTVKSNVTSPILIHTKY